MPAFSGNHSRGIGIAASGTLVLSFDAVLVRLADTSDWNIVFWRGLLIFISLLSYQLLRGARPRWRPQSKGEAIAALVAMLIFAANMVLFVVSISSTLTANTLVILSSSPFFAALFSRWFLGEHIQPRTWFAIAAAIAGVLLIFAGSIGGGTLPGDLCAVLIAVLLGILLTTLRRYPEIDRIAVVCASGLLVALVVWPLAQPLSLDVSSYAVLGVMGLVQMPMAMVLYATATRYLPAPEVALFLLVETVMGPVWVWLAVGEVPPELTFIGGAVVLLTITLHSVLSLRDGRRTAEA